MPPIKETNLNKIKSVFLSEVLTKAAVDIRAKQSIIVSDWNLFDTGDLERMLKGHFSINKAGLGGSLTMTYLTYARFLDMADKRRKVKKEGYGLYNKTVFGIIYGETLNSLKFGFTEEMAKDIENRIIEIVGENPLLGDLTITKK